MPERPDEHKIGGRAVAAVHKLLKDQGFAVDEIKEDYGEDLLVQTDHEGRMDASRLWIQVKGTANLDNYRVSKKSKKDRFKYSFPLGHAMRWIRTIDLVIVVLWDVEKETGWYAVPRRQVDEWESVLSGQKEITLQFGKTPGNEGGPAAKGVFSAEAMQRLVWESRFEHFRMLTVSALDVAKAQSPEPSTEGTENRKLVLIMNDLLKLLDIVDSEHEDPSEIMVKPEVRLHAMEIYERMLSGEMPKDPGTLMGLLACRVILERMAEIDPMLGMPAKLLGHASHALSLPLGLARFYVEEGLAPGASDGD